MMFATSLALLAQAFQGRDRGTAFGVFGAVTGAAVAVGPLVGGVITSGIGWEWIFFVNVPIGIAAVAFTIARVEESRDPDAAGIDWLGLITFSGSLFLLLRLLFVFALALLVAAINLHFLFGAGLWLAGGVAGVDRSTWGAVLSVHNPLYVVLILTGAGLLLEPFWLAALTAHVERVRARESGDDLRLWFAELRAKA